MLNVKEMTPRHQVMFEVYDKQTKKNFTVLFSVQLYSFCRPIAGQSYTAAVFAQT